MRSHRCSQSEDPHVCSQAVLPTTIKLAFWGLINRLLPLQIVQVVAGKSLTWIWESTAILRTSLSFSRAPDPETFLAVFGCLAIFADHFGNLSGRPRPSTNLTQPHGTLHNFSGVSISRQRNTAWIPQPAPNSCYCVLGGCHYHQLMLWKCNCIIQCEITKIYITHTLWKAMEIC